MTTVRFWAGAKAAAGVASEQVSAQTLADLLDLVRAGHGPELTRVLTVCSFVVDEAPVGTRPHEGVDVSAAVLVDVLPPFAGG